MVSMYKRKLVVELDEISKYKAEITVKDGLNGGTSKTVRVSSSPLELLLGVDIHAKVEKAVSNIYMELNDWEELDYEGETWSGYNFEFLRD